MQARFLAALVALAAPAAAQQNVTAIFVGRFDFTSLDAPNERTGGSITQMSGFDLSCVTPGPGAVARSWLPAAAQATRMGDPLGDGDYTRFDGYFPDNWDWSGPFVRYADRGKPHPPVFRTVRDNRVVLPFSVFTQTGTQTRPIVAGDFFRFLDNGDIEVFITQALLMKADGLDPNGGTESHGASALCQDAQGNLYYSPEEGGTWVLGNDPAMAMWCSRAGVIMIDAANITYDASGNVQDVVADSAHIIFGGANQSGPNGQPSIVDMALNAGANDYNGVPIASYYNTVGLALDPNGGTTTVSIPRVVGGNTVYDTVPNLLFTSDSGTHAATVFSTTVNTATNTPGSIAVVNGVKFGEDSPGTAANGSWWGVLQSGFSPTTMGFALIDALPAGSEPFVADAPHEGAVGMTDPNVELDFYAGPTMPLFMLLSAGPVAAGQFQPSADLSSLLGPLSFPSYYTTAVPSIILGLGVSDPAGYGSFTVTNPMSPANIGITLVFQGARLHASTTELSTPVTVQFK